MSDVIWTFAGGDDLACEQRGLRLVVDKSPIGKGYRFRVSTTREGKSAPLASGYREELRDALDAAERVSRTIAA